MGLFDIFKRKEQKIEQNSEQNHVDLPYKIDYSINKDGKLQIDYTDYEADFKQFYDTTRLIVQGEPIAFGTNNNRIDKVLVSWYGSEDAVTLGKNGEEIGRRTQYEEIYIGVDLNLLQTDQRYCSLVMNNLLKEKRVREYLQRGMQEQPQSPCGNYVGEIIKRDGTYKKNFSPNIGRLVHNSDFMKNKRRENARRIEEQKQRAMEEKKAQIARLQGELDYMSK